MNICLLNYYANMRQKALITLKTKSELIQNQNIGFMFIFFDNKKSIKLFKNYLKSPEIKDSKSSAVKKFGVKNWTVSSSPIASNIIWTAYGQSNPFDQLNNFLINLLLFFLTILLTNPVQTAHLILNWSKMIFGENSEASTVVLKAAGPLGLAIFNSFFIPTLVSLTTEYLFFELKSNKI